MEDSTLRELRNSPRFQVDLNARVTPAGAHSLEHPVRLVNLSKSGLQMECDPRLVQALMPRTQDERTRRHQVCMTILFELPAQVSNELMSIDAQVIYSRRLAQSRYLIGCAFTAMTDSDAESLSAFLIQHAGPC